MMVPTVNSAARMAALFCAFSCLLLLAPCEGQAASREELTGLWYSHLNEEGTVDGVSYTFRCQVVNNRADGTKETRFRYYAGDQLVYELVASYRWGVENNVFWAECVTATARGRTNRCSGRFEYDVLSVTPRLFQYKSRQTGIIYEAIRVEEGSRMACLQLSSFH